MCFLVITSQNGITGELAPDEHTLLLLHFNNSLEGANGETPTVSTGITFEQGLFGNGCRIHKSDSPYFGDSLYYQVPENFNQAEGSAEFWLKPRWVGQEFYVMQAFRGVRTFLHVGLEKLGALNSSGTLVLIRAFFRYSKLEVAETSTTLFSKNGHPGVGA